jgi:hypothetical protein
VWVDHGEAFATFHEADSEIVQRSRLSSPALAQHPHVTEKIFRAPANLFLSGVGKGGAEHRPIRVESKVDPHSQCTAGARLKADE